MDPVSTEPIAIPTCYGERDVITYQNCTGLFSSISDGSWLELEEFWGTEKHRIQHEEIQNVSSSLEKHLLFDDCLKKPGESVQSTSQNPSFSCNSGIVIRGKDIKDIPTSYFVSGLFPHEFPVIGTYVDRRVIPGFKYRVRLNHTDKYFFNGNAITLERIGMGYGKRLTFEDKNLNNNENYFWSDSYSNGYGFSIEAVKEEISFNIEDTKTNYCLGRVVVTRCSKEQIEQSTNIRDNGAVEKVIKVGFWYKILREKNADSWNLVPTETFVSGLAYLVKEKKTSSAKLERIVPENFVLPDCELLPVE